VLIFLKKNPMFVSAVLWHKHCRDRMTMSKKRLLLLALLFFASFNLAHAQQPKKFWRIGYLSSFDAAGESTRAEAIRLALHESGYIEGHNIAVEYRFGDGKRDRYPELTAELVRFDVDIIVAAGGTVQAAKNATKTIPIVMTGSGLLDPVEAGLVESLARPGGNVTGITNVARELGGKRLELLKEAIPKLARVAVLYETASPSSAFEVKEVLPGAARTLGLTLRYSEARAADGFEKIFAAMNKEHQDALYVLSSPVMNANQKRIAGHALMGRLPSIYGSRSGVDAGGLMSYGAELRAGYRRVAYYVDRILKAPRGRIV
jgi:putative tryptophan/tyrosine transport system substrate-binding protein